MGIAIAVVYLPTLVVFCLIGNVAWYWLCIRHDLESPASVRVGGFALGFAVSVALAVAVINAVPYAPDLQQFLTQTAVSLPLPLLVGVTCAIAARFAKRTSLSQRTVQFLAMFSGGVVNGVWGTPMLYFVRYW